VKIKPYCSILVLGTLFLTGGLRAQIPAPSTQPVQPALPRAVPAIPAPNPGAVANPGLYSGTNRAGRNIETTPRSSPIPAASPTHNSIIVASDNDTNAPDLAIEPKGSVTNAPEEMIPPGTIDFRGADLNQVLELYAMLRQRTILRAANLASPTFVLKTQTPLTKSEAIKALDAMLGMNGIAIIDVGDKFSKAAPSANAGQMGADFSKLRGSQLSDMGQFLTHVVQLKYVKPSEMVAVLQPFASAIANPILPIDSSQILVLRDFTENVKRMLQVVDAIDVSVPSEYISEVIPIKYAKASEISSALNSLSTGGGGGGGVIGGGQTSNRSLSGTRSTGGFGRSGTGANYGGGSTPFGSQPPGMTTPQATMNQAAGGNSFTDRLRGIINRAATSGEIVVFGQTKMIADERTNSLLIYASREDMKTIKEIISKLDVVLAQVLIEAVIIEVTLNNERDVGFSYIQGQPTGSGFFKGIGAINNGNALSQGAFGTIGAATTNALSLPGGFSYLANLGNNDLDVTLTAVQTDSRAKILQRPRIQTSHNEPAQLFVGESRPYPSGSYYGGGSFGGYSSIQAVNIGVTLEVTPLINPDGLVVMDIHQTIESANGSVVIANVGEVPVTSRKEAAAKVSVRDHDTIILGGLIETSKTKSGSGVPFLMNVPLLGYLFRSNSDKETRNELVVLIRPTVLPTPEVAALTARAEKDKMPGVKRAETEIQTEEANRLKQLNDNLKSDRELNAK
jgi:general secretion pathway protein D